MSNDYLAHYGVVGMRWGVRKSRASGSSGPDHHHAHAGHKRHVDGNAGTRRMHRIATATGASKSSRISPGTRKFLGDAAFAIGTGVVTAVLSEGVLTGLAFAEIATNPAVKMMAQNAIAGAVQLVGGAAVNKVGNKIGDAAAKSADNKLGDVAVNSAGRKIGGGRVAKINSIR